MFSDLSDRFVESRLAWARELKCCMSINIFSNMPSRLAWARELKSATACLSTSLLCRALRERVS